MLVRILVGGLLGAFIGYFTNWLALRMLFYPKRSILGIQGLLPKYKEVFAEKAADFVFQFIDFEAILRDIANEEQLSSGILDSKWGIIRKSIAYFIAADIEEWLKNEALRESIARSLKDLSPQAKATLAKRIMKTEIDNLIDIILKSTSREMRFIQILGGIFGFVIGILQPLIFR